MNLEAEQEVTAYDRNYVVDNRLTMKWYPQRVATMARTGSMLELGLGHGYSTEYFARIFRRYLVVEGSKEMINRFRDRFPNKDIEVTHSYFENFDTDERFDSIGMGFVLEHVDDPAAIVRRFARFLAPGGSIFIAVPNAESLHRRFGYAAGLLSNIEALSLADQEFGHKRYFTLTSLRKMVEREGLTVRNVEGLLLKPITTQQMIDLDLNESILQAMLKVGIDYPELCNSLLMQVGVDDLDKNHIDT